MTPRLTAVVALLIGGSMAACGGPLTPSSPTAGTLGAGTASISVAGENPGPVHTVSCLVDGPVTTISTGDGSSGSTTVVSNADGLAVKSVQLRAVAGFTGSYFQDVAGQAHVGLSGTTYTIEGSADGFLLAQPSFRASRAFSITVAC
jgi:ipoprotein LpqH